MVSKRTISHAAVDSRICTLEGLPENRDALLTTNQAAYLLGLSPRTLEALRLRGGGPAFVALSTRAIRYRRADLLQWVESRVCTSTSDDRYPNPSPVRR